MASSPRGKQKAQQPQEAKFSTQPPLTTIGAGYTEAGAAYKESAMPLDAKRACAIGFALLFIVTVGARL